MSEATDTGDGQYGIYFHELGTPQNEDIVVWSAHGLFLNHPLVCSTGSGGRAWLVGDVYRNTDQAAENFMVELPDLSAPGLGPELARLIKSEKKWLCKGYSGTMKCKLDKTRRPGDGEY